jgi:sigma-B regulation protein RsbQ
MNNNTIKKYNLKIYGTGNQTLVFAHGYGCDQNMWRFVAPHFYEKYKVVLFDHIGSGKSDTEAYNFETYSSLHAYASDVLQICKDLNLQNIVFIGHSVSAMIGILAAISSPRMFQKLILVAPSPCYINYPGYSGGFGKEDVLELIKTLESNYLGWSKTITPVIVGDKDKQEIEEELTHSFCAMNPAIAKHFAKVTFLSDHREDLKNCTTSSLIIQCKPDALAPIKVGEFMHQELQNSTLKVIESPGHCPHLTTPKIVIQVIEDYLKTQNV